MQIFIKEKKHFFGWWKYAVILICLTALGGSIASYVTFKVLVPKYSSRSQVLISSPEATDVNRQIEEVNVNLQMMDTYYALIWGDSVLERSVAKLQGEQPEVTRGELQESLSVSREDNSMLLTVTASSTKPERAEKIASAVTEGFQETVQEVLHGNNILVTSKAKVNTYAFFPNHPLNLLIGMIIGFMIAVGIAYLVYLASVKRKTGDSPAPLTPNQETVTRTSRWQK